MIFQSHFLWRFLGAGAGSASSSPSWGLAGAAFGLAFPLAFGFAAFASDGVRRPRRRGGFSTTFFGKMGLHGRDGY